MGSALLNPATWKDKWSELDKNASASTGSASLLKDMDELALTLTSKLQLGLDVVDDCTPIKAAKKGCCKFLFFKPCRLR